MKEPQTPDWAALHRDLAEVYERHGLRVEANVHRRLAASHEAARIGRKEG